MCAFIPTVTLTLQLTFESILSSAPTPFLFLLPLLPHLGTPSVKLNSFRSHYALGRDGMRSTHKVQSHLFVHSLICLICTICFDQALQCAHLFTRSLTHSLAHSLTHSLAHSLPSSWPILWGMKICFPTILRTYFIAFTSKSPRSVSAN